MTNALSLASALTDLAGSEAKAYIAAQNEGMQTKQKIVDFLLTGPFRDPNVFSFYQRLDPLSDRCDGYLSDSMGQHISARRCRSFDEDGTPNYDGRGVISLHLSLEGELAVCFGSRKTSDRVDLESLSRHNHWGYNLLYHTLLAVTIKAQQTWVDSGEDKERIVTENASLAEELTRLKAFHESVRTES